MKGWCVGAGYRNVGGDEGGYGLKPPCRDDTVGVSMALRQRRPIAAVDGGELLKR